MDAASVTKYRPFTGCIFKETIMRIQQWITMLGTLAFFALASCASTSSGTPATYGYGSSDYGVVQSIEVVKKEHGLGLGAVAGAVVGGVLGHQVGEGRGNTAATIAGAAGGAYAGNEIEKRNRAAGEIYRLHVRLDNGATQAFEQESSPNLRVGDRVRIVNGSVQPA
jgi:outer membrane lipoprotein SlyB